MAIDAVFVVRDGFDRAQGGGQSRYGGCLRQHAEFFETGEGLTGDRARFAVSAFTIARRPVMSPPYLDTHSRVLGADTVWDAEGGCGVLVELAVPTPTAIAQRLPSAVAGWQQDTTGAFSPPGRHDLPAVYGRLAVRLPLPVELLPNPVYTEDGVAEVATAKRAVRTIANYVNSVLVHLITHLDAGERGDDDDPYQYPLPWPNTPS